MSVKYRTKLMMMHNLSFYRPVSTGVWEEPDCRTGYAYAGVSE